MSRTRTIPSVIIIVLTPQRHQIISMPTKKTNKQMIIRYQTNLVYIYNRSTSDNRSLMFMAVFMGVFLLLGLFGPLGNFVFGAIMFLDDFVFLTNLLLGVFVFEPFYFLGLFGGVILLLDHFAIGPFCYWTFLPLGHFAIGSFCHWAVLFLGLFAIGPFCRGSFCHWIFLFLDVLTRSH